MKFLRLKIVRVVIIKIYSNVFRTQLITGLNRYQLRSRFLISSNLADFYGSNKPIKQTLLPIYLALDLL